MSGFSRIVHVLKTTTSASSCELRLAEAERLEHALDALGVVAVHLAAEGGDVVAPHPGHCRSSRAGTVLTGGARIAASL